MKYVIFRSVVELRGPVSGAKRVDKAVKRVIYLDPLFRYEKATSKTEKSYDLACFPHLISELSWSDPYNADIPRGRRSSRDASAADCSLVWVHPWLYRALDG